MERHTSNTQKYKAEGRKFSMIDTLHKKINKYTAKIKAKLLHVFPGSKMYSPILGSSHQQLGIQLAGDKSA